MSDYTPTTEDIRNFWGDDETSQMQFDRWLAEVKAQAWQEGEIAGREHDTEGYNIINGMRNVNPYRQGETE